MNTVTRVGSLISSTIAFLLICLLAFGRASPEIKVISVEPEAYTPDAQIQNNEILLITNITNIVIHCTAHYPVQWEFQGFTSPLQLEVKAIRKSGPKLSDPTFIAQLVVYRVSAAITGAYRCRSVLNPVKESTVHIFAQDKGYRGQDPILLKYGQTVEVVAENAESVVKFPCAVSKPNTSVYLYKKSEITGKYEVLKTDGVSLAFDPKEGFKMNLKDFEKPWGKYMCSPEIERTFDRLYVNLLGKPDYKVNPFHEFVEVPEGQPLVLRCEAVEQIKWNILGALINDSSRVEKKSEYSPTSFYAYSSTLTYSDLDPMDATEIECVREKDGRRIYKWKYQVVGKHDMKRRGFVKYYSKRTSMENFACWSRNSKSPDVSFIECRNPMECQIRGQCLQNANKCDPAFVRLCTGGCTITAIENRTGILQCSGDGIFQQIRQFVGISGTYLYNSVMDAPREEQLHVEGNHVFKVGSTAEFTCTGSAFLFAQGFRWGLKVQGNTVKFLEPGSTEVISLEESFLPSGNILAKLVLKLDSLKITQLNCFAPFWNTTDWDSRNHRIFIQG